jgi:aminopeptidase N
MRNTTYSCPGRILRYIATLSLCQFFSAFSLQAQDTSAIHLASGGKLNPLQAIMDIRHYTLALDIDVPGKSIDGYVEISLELSKPTDTLLFDLVHVLKARAITVNKKKTSFFQNDDKIFVTTRGGFIAGKQTVRIDYGGKPPVAVHPPWEGGFTWTKDSNGNPWVVINCQLEGGKVYFPCKDHPSDEPNEGVDLLVTVPSGLTVAGPGLLQTVTAKKNNRTTFHWKTRYTISNYCILFNIAKYKLVSRIYTTIEGNKVPMQFYVLEEDTSHAQKVLDIRERDTRILEKYFGEYPWVKEKIGIAEVPNPGMEHQTMITYGDKFVYEKVGGQDYSANLFHEFSHEWWANKVTNKDWAHMWIQEGIATYAEALCFRELAGEEGYRKMILSDRLNSDNLKPLVQGEGLNSSEAYTGDIYSKGAFFMHTLRYVIGDILFFPALKKLATDPKYTYDNFVTTDDVEKLFSQQAGQDLKPLFDFYLRTIDKLKLEIWQTAEGSYLIGIRNFFMPLPVDITTSEGTRRMIIDKKGIKVNSTSLPVVDAQGAYMKTVLSQ